MAEEFKLGFDARMVDYTGIGTYIKNLLLEYQRLRFLRFLSVYGDSSHAFLSSLAGAEIIHSKTPVYSLSEQFSLGFKIRGDNRIFHSPHYNAPLFYGGRLVLTIHDLTHLRHPEYLPSKKAHIYAKIMLNRASGKAARIITSSVSSMRDIVEILKVPEKKITLIPLGVGKSFQPSGDRDRMLAFRQKYGIEKRFILYAGNMKGHKNLGVLLDAYRGLKKNRGIEHSLVLAASGRKDEAFFERASEAGLSGDIKLLPFLPDDEMPVLYNCADVFVFPSIAEGFGLPPLEALACGVPCVLSDVPVMHEVAGEAAVFCKPDSPEEFEEGIYGILTDGRKRDVLSETGAVRAAEFSWEAAAEKTINVYNECACG